MAEWAAEMANMPKLAKPEGMEEWADKVAKIDEPEGMAEWAG